MTRYHLATRCNILLRYERTPSDLPVVACAQLGVTFKPPKKKGEIKDFIGQYEVHYRKKKSMQHISGLWGTSWIYIDISTFLEKLFKVILFLIIPIDSIKYLVSYFFLLSARPQAGKFFFFWDCFESAKHKYWSFYAASTLKVAWSLKMEFLLYVAQQIPSKM